MWFNSTNINKVHVNGHWQIAKLSNYHIEQSSLTYWEAINLVIKVVVQDKNTWLNKTLRYLKRHKGVWWMPRH